MSAPAVTEHSWLPRATCGVSCVSVGDAAQVRRPLVVLRVALRVMLALLLVPGVPLVVMPLPGRTRVQRIYCRLVLRLFGVRITVSGSPVRNLRGVLVVSGHVSWLDVFCIGSVLPGSFVARADMFTGRTIGIVARILKIIPIERASLRRLPGVVDTIARRLRAGQTVVAFPEGTTWCGRPGDDAGRPAARAGAGCSHRGCGAFYPAMFQAAIDAGRPVQPLRLTYHHVDGTVP
ncbi:lysophospholipid acyltransferase family protein, partial [Mycobacterium tuberculosis]|uniref:lysophospholipid acyltransferase family protein n=1 Tax=Mycobacterium tuberculosis TaxID=1773 RepID=UPI0032B482AC